MNSTDIVALAFSGQYKGELTLEQTALLMASVGVSHPMPGKHDAALILLNRIVGVEGLKTYTRTRFIEVKGEWSKFEPYTEDMSDWRYIPHHLRETGTTGKVRFSTGARPEGAEPIARAVEELCLTAEAMSKCLAGPWGEEIRDQGFESRALLRWIEASGAIAAKVVELREVGAQGRIVTRAELLNKGSFRVMATKEPRSKSNTIQDLKANCGLRALGTGQYSLDDVKAAALRHKAVLEFVWSDDE